MRKYRNTPTVIDGIRFDSQAEGRRYQELKLLQQGRRIRDLKLQVMFALYGKNGSAVCRYKADFMYQEGEQIVVEDVKSKATVTRDFRIKQKLMADNYPGIEFRVVMA